MDADWLFAEVLYNILTHVSWYADDIHEVHLVATLRVLYAAYACLVTVYECKDVELLVLSILLAYLLELKAAE